MKKIEVKSNYLTYSVRSQTEARKLARKLLGASRLYATHPFCCGAQGDRSGVLVYGSPTARDADQDGSTGVQIETF